MSGRKIKLLDCNSTNNFSPIPPPYKIDLIYLCSPNNPTGSVLTHKQLKVWVDYAHLHKSIILFDGAYEAFISDPSLPRSIYEIKDAKDCSIEFCSFSKTAGFTGTRCGYTIIPEKLLGYTNSNTPISIHNLWNRRQTTKFNGTSYIVQRGAASIFTLEGQNEIKSTINYYMDNAKTICTTLSKINIDYYGGTNAPYIWFKCPYNLSSWDFFDTLLEEASIVGTPGIGFGNNGDGYFRLTAFANKQDTIEACSRIEFLFRNKINR